ncbi:hypothetical protein F5Y14DRAFT_408147 [Nemania sp. NC0429]|nr:hypothetical protein F5Y14DRAFT_408147 [Nemania sp. NC0429]
MAALIPDPVTIDRAYFDTLVRRAKYDKDGQESHDETIISVPKQEYENLLLLSRQFANLKRSLLGAGVTEASIATLVQDSTGAPPTDPYVADTHVYNHGRRDDLQARPQEAYNPAATYSPAAAYSPAATYGPAATYDPTASGTSRNVPHIEDEPRLYGFEENHDWSSHGHIGGTFTPSHSADGPTDTHVDSLYPAQKPQLHHMRICKRTIVLCGLPPIVTLGDVTGVVRGGQLLDIFLRSVEHTASVSFVREDDAARFYEHARRNDIYIRNKRVSIKWADRQFILPGHVANKITTGATRNLIVRRCAAHHTEASIREDLEHIHNLIVIKVEFIGGSCYIKTNSVHNAMFARTCMMSRATYKGSKIEWDGDECDQPIEVAPKTSAKSLPQRGAPAKPAVAETRNRFDMLRLDDDDNNESDDKFDTSSEMPSTVDVAA